MRRRVLQCCRCKGAGFQGGPSRGRSRSASRPDMASFFEKKRFAMSRILDLACTFFQKGTPNRDRQKGFGFKKTSVADPPAGRLATPEANSLFALLLHCAPNAPWGETTGTPLESGAYVTPAYTIQQSEKTGRPNKVMSYGAQVRWPPHGAADKVPRGGLGTPCIYGSKLHGVRAQARFCAVTQNRRCAERTFVCCARRL